MNRDRKKYYKYLHSPEWKKKRQEAFKIHGKVCKNCGATSTLEINHKHYRNIFNENVQEDLEVLCHRCHCIHHGMNPNKAWNKQNKKRRKRNRKSLNGGSAMTMEEYRAIEAAGKRSSTMGNSYRKWN